MGVQSLGQGGPLEEGLEPTPEFLPGESHGQRSLAGYRVAKRWKQKKQLSTSKQRITTYQMIQKQQKFMSHSSGGWKSKITALTDQVFGEGFLVYRRHPLVLTLHGGRGKGAFSSLFYKTKFQELS